MDDKHDPPRGEHRGLVELAARVFFGGPALTVDPRDDQPHESRSNGHHPDEKLPPYVNGDGRGHRNGRE